MIINKINFPIYGIMIILSVTMGAIYIFFNLKKELNKSELILYIFFFLIFTLLGSIAITNLFSGQIGLTSYAGLASVITCAIVFEYIVPKDNIYLKYTMICVPLMYSIGKIGCFLTGCCYGIEYNGIFNVTYIDELNIQLFPIQALESIVFMILFIILNKIKDNKYIIEITLIICALSKFLLDFLRYNHMTKIITKNQMISIAIIIIGVILILRKNLKK